MPELRKLAHKMYHSKHIPQSIPNNAILVKLMTSKIAPIQPKNQLIQRPQLSFAQKTYYLIEKLQSSPSDIVSKFIDNLLKNCSEQDLQSFNTSQFKNLLKLASSRKEELIRLRNDFKINNRSDIGLIKEKLKYKDEVEIFEFICNQELEFIPELIQGIRNSFLFSFTNFSNYILHKSIPDMQYSKNDDNPFSLTKASISKKRYFEGAFFEFVIIKYPESTTLEFIHNYIRLSKPSFQGLESILSKIKSLGLIPKTETFSLLVQNFSFKEGLEFFNILYQHNNHSINLDDVQYAFAKSLGESDLFEFFFNSKFNLTLKSDLVEKLLLYVAYNKPDLVSTLIKSVCDAGDIIVGIGMEDVRKYDGKFRNRSMEKNRNIVKIDSLVVDRAITILAQSGKTSAAQYLLTELKVPSGQIYPNLLEVTNALLKYGQIQQSIDLIHQIECQGIRVGKRARIQIIKKLLSIDSFSRAKEFIGEWDTEFCNLFIESYIQKGLLAELELFRAEMKALNIKENIKTKSILIEGHLQKGSIDYAFKVLKSLKKQHDVALVYEKFLKFFIKTGNWEIIDRVYREMEGIKSDICMSLMLRSFAIRQDHSSIMALEAKVGNDLKSYHGYPEFFRDLIIYYLRTDDLKKAEQILKNMLLTKDSQVAYSICSFISYHARKNDYPRAEYYLELYLFKYPPHSRCFNILIRSVSANILPLSKAKEYWERMKELKIPLDAEAYTSYIATHTGLGHYQESERLYKQFLKTGQSPTIQILSTQIILHGKLQNTQKLEEIYQTATNKITSAYESSMLLNALICGYSYSNDHKKVMQIYNLLKKGKSKNQRKAEVFNRLESDIDNENFGINNVTLCVVIDSIGFNSNLKALEKCWKESVDSGIYMGVNVYTSLMEAYLRLGEVDKGVDVVLAYKKPNFKMLRNCLDLVPDSKRKEVYEIFRKEFPEINVDYKEVVKRKPRHIKEKSNAPEGKMLLRNGVLILPGIKFQFDKLHKSI